MNNLFKFRMKAFALIALLLVSFSSAFAQQKIAIVDAGSSGSRLYVYEFSTDGKSVSTLYNGDSIVSKLSGVVVCEDSVKKYMDSITAKYKTNETIPLYVLATAGMRTGNSESQVYNFIRSYRHNNYEIKKAITISGRYEGLYAWIALNYEYKNLGYSISTPQKPLTYSGSTFGIIEIGGASMQIAFATQSSDPTPKYNEKDLINRKGFSRIYCKSYLGGGVDRIFDNFKSPDWDKRLYSNSIKGLPKLNANMKFYGLGTPIAKAIENITTKKLDMGLDDDTNENHHPKSNANYIKWLAKDLNIKIENIKIPKTKISWTKGAALDIIINGQEPEPFDYANPN